MPNYKLALSVSAMLISNIAAAQYATTLEKLATIEPPVGGTVAITDPGKEAILYRVADDTATAPCSTVLQVGQKKYKRLIMGAVNAGWWMSESSNDNATAFECALSLAKPAQEVYLGPGTYRFSRLVVIPREREANLNVQGTLLFPNSSGILVRGGNHKIYVRTIRRSLDNSYSDNAGAGLVLEDAFYNNIHIGSIEGFGEGIKLTSTGMEDTDKGTQYNRITFDRLYYNNTGISLTTGSHSTGEVGSTAPWVNENTIFGGSIHAQVGLRMIKDDESNGPQTDPYNNNKFYNLGFERNDVAIKMSFAHSNIFIAPRFEPNNGVLPEIFISEKSRGNVFITGTVYSGTFKAPGKDTSIFGRVLDSGGTHQGPVIGSGETPKLEVLVKKDPVR